VIPNDRLLLRRRYAALVAEVLHRLLHAAEALASAAGGWFWTWRLQTNTPLGQLD